MGEFLQLLVDRIDTPIGELMVVADRGGNLRAVDWADREHRMRRLLRLPYGEDGFKLEPNRNPMGSTRAIASYFAGELRAIDGLPRRAHRTGLASRPARCVQKSTLVSKLP
jgi:methylated-DNA-[protein]-cysteine S-methyltransferase